MNKRAPHPLSGAAYRHLRIGLLGGSFNPAHDGHLHISLLALKQMRLDQVWWLVSPQNPLKPSYGMASFAERFAFAERLTGSHPRILVTEIEGRLGTRFTADTLRCLRKRFPHTHFVWMMGADNLLQVPRWQRWREIFERCDVAVYRRPPYAVGVLRGIAARRYWKHRLSPTKAALLGKGKTTGWILFSNKLNSLSATEIRAELKLRA